MLLKLFGWVVDELYGISYLSSVFTMHILTTISPQFKPVPCSYFKFKHLYMSGKKQHENKKSDAKILVEYVSSKTNL